MCPLYMFLRTLSHFPPLCPFAPLSFTEAAILILKPSFPASPAAERESTSSRWLEIGGAGEEERMLLCQKSWQMFLYVSPGHIPSWVHSGLSPRAVRCSSLTGFIPSNPPLEFRAPSIPPKQNSTEWGKWGGGSLKTIWESWQ